MKQKVRSLAAEAKMTVKACRSCLANVGIKVAKGAQTLAGTDLQGARVALGLPWDRSSPAEQVNGKRLDKNDLMLRLLRPLREKGKVGRNHTTPIENVHSHGIPDHQKAEARDLLDKFLVDGLVNQKTSQSRQHVWLTAVGLRRLEELERRSAAAG